MTFAPWVDAVADDVFGEDDTSREVSDTPINEHDFGKNRLPIRERLGMLLLVKVAIVLVAGARFDLSGWWRERVSAAFCYYCLLCYDK